MASKGETCEVVLQMNGPANKLTLLNLNLMKSGGERLEIGGDTAGVSTERWRQALNGMITSYLPCPLEAYDSRTDEYRWPMDDGIFTFPRGLLAPKIADVLGIEPPVDWAKPARG